MKKLLLILVMCTGCKTYYTTEYKISTPDGNFYTNEFRIIKDSIFIVEFNRNKIRRTGMFKVSDVIIDKK